MHAVGPELTSNFFASPSHTCLPGPAFLHVSLSTVRQSRLFPEQDPNEPATKAGHKTRRAQESRSAATVVMMSRYSLLV